MSDEFEDKDLVEDLETGLPEVEDDDGPVIIPEGFLEEEPGM